MAKIQIRVADDTKAEWLMKSKVAGVTLTELIHKSVAGLNVLTPKKKANSVDPALLRELASIGNNLNQLARWANRYKAPIDAMHIITELAEIRQALADLRASVEGGVHAD